MYAFPRVRFLPEEIFLHLAENLASVLGLYIMRTELCIKKTGELRRILDIKLEKLAGVSQSKLKACPGFKVSLVSVHMGDVPRVKNMIARYDMV